MDPWAPSRVEQYSKGRRHCYRRRLRCMQLEDLWGCMQLEDLWGCCLGAGMHPHHSHTLSTPFLRLVVGRHPQPADLFL